jgi:hypothetical protein
MSGEILARARAAIKKISPCPFDKMRTLVIKSSLEIKARAAGSMQFSEFNMKDRRTVLVRLFLCKMR